jgi:hypothetical protein
MHPARQFGACRGGPDSWDCPGGLEIDRTDPGVRLRRADECRPKHPREDDVVDETGAPPQEPGVFSSLHPLPEEPRRSPAVADRHT